MSEQDGHVKPSNKQGSVRSAIRLAFLIGIVVLISTSYWLRMPRAPITESSPDPRWRTEADSGGGPAWVLLLPEEARAIAIEEVKKREGWSGTAGNVSQEGGIYYVTVRGKAERSVAIAGPGRKVIQYFDPRNPPWKSSPNVAKPAQAWKDLLAAMAGRDEKRIRQLTTQAGFEALGVEKVSGTVSGTKCTIGS